MKAPFLLLLAVIASLAVASPAKKIPQQRIGVDLLSADYVRDGRGNYLVIRPDKTPFDSDAEARARYQEAFAAGFKSGSTGILSRHPATPQLLLPGELEGWSAGQWSGYRAYKETRANN